MKMAMSEGELQKLGAVFAELGIEGDMKSEDDFKQWILSHKSVKQEDPTPVDKDEDDDTKGDGNKEMKQGGFEHRPKVTNFWGHSNKDSVPFEVWKFEVECLIQDKKYREDTKTEAVRKSLKGEAAKLAMRLGHRATVEDIIYKLEGRYGNVVSEATLLSQFFETTQKADEDVADYSVRLEDLMQPVWQQRLIDTRTRNTMLKMRLWAGLRNENLKVACRHKYEQVPDFDDLVIEIRAMEKEFDGSKDSEKKSERKAKTHMLQHNKEEQTRSQEDRASHDKPDWKKFEEKLDRLEKEMSELRTKKQERDKRHYRGSSQGRYGRNGRGQYRGSNRGRADDDPDEEPRHTSGKQKERGEVVCYRCGEIQRMQS